MFRKQTFYPTSSILAKYLKSSLKSIRLEKVIDYKHNKKSMLFVTNFTNLKHFKLAQLSLWYNI